MKVIKTVLVIICILFIGFIFIKLSLVEVWSSEDFLSTYSIKGDDGWKKIISIRPDNKIVFYYNDNSGLEEIVLTKAR